MRTILKNGKIYVEKNIFAEALLIEDGIIKDLGSNEEISLLATDKIVDLEGKTVLPGLNDSHLHLVGVGSFMNICVLTSARSIDDIIRLGQEFLANKSDLTALVGRGWNQDYFTSGEKRMPTRYDLDKISREIPIVFVRVCGHMASGNSKAFELLEIDENTRLDGGVIELGTDGKPSGVVSENAVGFLSSVIPAKTKKDIENEFLKAAELAISLGITSVQSCDSMDEDPRMIFEIIHDIYKNKKTQLRYGHQFNFQDINDFRDYLDSEFVSGEYDEKFLSKGALKLFIDGSLGARTALMLDDYKDAPGRKGVEVLTVEQLDAICSLAAEKGVRIITHAIGDGAVEMILNAYEKVLVNGENPLRHGIVHCQITNMEQLERIAKLNIPVIYQPIFLDYDLNIVEDRVGEELASTSYAFNSLYKLGAPISFSTDAPVENCNPWYNLYSAVNRMTLDGKPKGGFYPNEKMDLQDAIDCYTYGSAYNEFKEDFKGRLKAGYVADLIVLDRDIFTINPEEIKDIIVEKIIIDGSFIDG